MFSQSVKLQARRCDGEARWPRRLPALVSINGPLTGPQLVDKLMLCRLNLVQDVASHLRTRSWMPTYMERDSQKLRGEVFESRSR